jgi:Ser/Thr protein kinase RdoA (MazF antagonist)
MPLFETLPVDVDAVSALVLTHWGLTLGERLKASQNHTFAASDTASGARFAVRVTPDPSGRHAARIADELTFVSFLATLPLAGVCAPVPPRDAAAAGVEGAAVRAGELTLCVVRWAEGAPLDFMAYRWMLDDDVVHAWGAWLARLHAASRAFAVAHPSVAARLQRWDETHSALLAGTPVHADDAAAAGDPSRFGVLHGDLNVSNFFLVEGAPPTLSVFDWDQACRGWFEYDIAHTMLTSVMLAEGGSLPAGDPVPQADAASFERRVVAGYESVAGAGAVDRPRLSRMLALKKRFYATFCARAAVEGAPDDMAWFIAYVNRWMEKAPPPPV